MNPDKRLGLGMGTFVGIFWHLFGKNEGEIWVGYILRVIWHLVKVCISVECSSSYRTFCTVCTNNKCIPVKLD